MRCDNKRGLKPDGCRIRSCSSSSHGRVIIFCVCVLATVLVGGTVVVDGFTTSSYGRMYNPSRSMRVAVSRGSTKSKDESTKAGDAGGGANDNKGGMMDGVGSAVVSPAVTELKGLVDKTKVLKDQYGDNNNNNEREEDFDSYSRCLMPTEEERKNVLLEGSEYRNTRVKGPFSKMFEYVPGQTVLRRGVTALGNIYAATTRKRNRRPGSLILLRCGESEDNVQKIFSGWNDPDLTARGVSECEYAAQLLMAQGYEIDVVYTSRLQRSIKSAWTILQTMESLFVPVYKTVRLNQRHYGALTGLSKVEVAHEIGSDVVDAWRNSLKARPPKMSRSNPSHPIHDRRYADLLPESLLNNHNNDLADDLETVSPLLPSTESLLDCQERARPLWDHKIKQDIKDGKTVLVVGHRDSLRGLIKEIDQVEDQNISTIRLPKGIPLVYKFDSKTYEPIRFNKDDNDKNVEHASGMFLEKPDKVKALLQAQDELLQLSLAEEVNGGHSRRHATVRESLRRLRLEQRLPVAARPAATAVSGISIPKTVPATTVDDEVPLEFERWEDDPCEFEEYDIFAGRDVSSISSRSTSSSSSPTVTANIMPLTEGKESPVNPTAANVVSSTKEEGKGPSVGPYVVLIRHGRTPHNNMGLFTGWEDPPLAKDGVQDAINAGRLLKMHNFEFDVVYTSWLTRAIQTAFYAIDELGCTWLPMVKSWRLNERMYGDLTGKSKQRVANEFGEDQLKKWRRGYTIRPPPVSSYSLNYPGNDARRAKHFDDLPISISETIARSVNERKFVLHRKFPKTESLKDCMDRSIPFYAERIKKEAVLKGKRVLITSHENALRGILMHLCDIPEDAMNQLHLPNGLPLVYNVKGKCISLLDDGSGRDPMEVHDFGPAAQYLFKPCQLDDDFYDSMLKP